MRGGRRGASSHRRRLGTAGTAELQHGSARAHSDHGATRPDGDGPAVRGPERNMQPRWRSATSDGRLPASPASSPVGGRIRRIHAVASIRTETSERAMLTAWERHLLAVYLSNAASSLYHRNEKASALATWVADRENRIEFGSKRRRNHRRRLEVDADEVMSARKLHRLQKALKEERSTTKGPDAIALPGACAASRRRRGSTEPTSASWSFCCATGRSR